MLLTLVRQVLRPSALAVKPATAICFHGYRLLSWNARIWVSVSCWRWHEELAAAIDNLCWHSFFCKRLYETKYNPTTQHYVSATSFIKFHFFNFSWKADRLREDALPNRWANWRPSWAVQATVDGNVQQVSSQVWPHCRGYPLLLRSLFQSSYIKLYICVSERMWPSGNLCL